MAPSGNACAQMYGSSHHLAPTMSAPACDVREGTIGAEIRDLHAQLQAMDDVTGQLRLRLENVVLNRPTGSNKCDAAPCNPVQRCEVAGQIHAAVDLACNITAKVNDMLCSLEI